MVLHQYCPVNLRGLGQRANSGRAFRVTWGVSDLNREWSFALAFRVFATPESPCISARPCSRRFSSTSANLNKKPKAPVQATGGTVRPDRLPDGAGARLCDVLHHPGFRVHAQRYRRPHAGKSLADKVERWLTTRGLRPAPAGRGTPFLN